MRYLVPISTGNWARYVDRIRLQVRTGVDQHRLLRVLPNRLTSVYSTNHYKEENYLKVKIVIFKYITPPYSNGLVCSYIALVEYVVFLCTKFPARTKLFMWLSYPLSYSFTGFISPVFCVLTVNLSKSFLSTCTIQYIKSVIPAPSSPALSLKIILISKLLIRGVQCPNSI